MSKTEIHRKFDEIVAFAEVENLLTPSKTLQQWYANAACVCGCGTRGARNPSHRRSIICWGPRVSEEVLGKMGEVAKGGRTIIFVSHQMNQIRRLCNRVLWIDAGQLRCQGLTSEISAQYEVASSGRLSLQEGRDNSGVKVYHENWKSWNLRRSPNIFDSFGQ